jgi:hypothetical protein
VTILISAPEEMRDSSTSSGIDLYRSEGEILFVNVAARELISSTCCQRAWPHPKEALSPALPPEITGIDYLRPPDPRRNDICKTISQTLLQSQAGYDRVFL